MRKHWLKLKYLFSNLNLKGLKSKWADYLIGCPSQCTLDIEYKNKKYQIYLRWRHNDPWTADLIPYNANYSAWISLNINFWKDIELEECKKDAIKQTIKYFKEYEIKSN